MADSERIIQSSILLNCDNPSKITSSQCRPTHRADLVERAIAPLAEMNRPIANNNPVKTPKVILIHRVFQVHFTSIIHSGSYVGVSFTEIAGLVE